MGMSANLGTKVNRRKRAVRLDPNVVENIGPERGDKRDWVVVKVVDARKETKEVTCYKLLLWDPEFLTMIVDDGVLMGMAVNGVGTSRGSKEVREEVD